VSGFGGQRREASNSAQLPALRDAKNIIESRLCYALYAILPGWYHSFLQGAVYEVEPVAQEGRSLVKPREGCMPNVIAHMFAQQKKFVYP
jgi:hypothetical protein